MFVKLRFRNTVRDPLDRNPPPIMVEAIDAQTGDTVAFAPLKAMAQKLASEGFHYIAGTQAAWEKAA